MTQFSTLIHTLKRGLSDPRTLAAGSVAIMLFGLTLVPPPVTPSTSVVPAPPVSKPVPVQSATTRKTAPQKPHATKKPATSITKTSPVAAPTPTVKPKPKPISAPTRVADTTVAPKAISGLAPAPTPEPAPAPAQSVPASENYTSLNWAGYAASTQTYSAVSGSWTIPTAQPSGSTTSTDATWIGIGGVKGSDLIQIGTENTVSADGVLASAVFYEMLPDAAVFPTSILVTAGDTVSASLSEVTPGVWSAMLHDDTTGQGFVVTLDYVSSHSSGEWIEEDPSYRNGQLAPLDNFGSVSFDNVMTIANGVSLTAAASGAGSVTMVGSNGAPRISVTSLGGDGKSFSAIEQ